MSYGAIIYNGKNSLIDFDLYPATKEIPVPLRKSITETVPYMSGVWDFSYHDGDVDEYEAITIKYTFDVIAETKAKLNEQKIALVAWIHSRGEQKLFDTDLSTEYHYFVYQAQASWSETDLQGLLTVEFLCYPFRKARQSVAMTSGSNSSSKTFTVNNTGARPANITARVTGGSVAFTVGSYGSAVSDGTYENFYELPVGTTEFSVKGFGTLTLEYEIEVL